MKTTMIATAVLTLLLLASGCGEDCRTIPCDCGRRTDELFRTEHAVSDTIEARQAFVIYQEAVAEDPQLLPETLKIEGAFGLGYIFRCGLFQPGLGTARVAAALPVRMDHQGALDGRLTVYRF